MILWMSIRVVDRVADANLVARLAALRARALLVGYLGTSPAAHDGLNVGSWPVIGPTSKLAASSAARMHASSSPRSTMSPAAVLV